MLVNQAWGTVTWPGFGVCGGVGSLINRSARIFGPCRAGRAANQHTTPPEDGLRKAGLGKQSDPGCSVQGFIRGKGIGTCGKDSAEGCVTGEE